MGLAGQILGKEADHLASFSGICVGLKRTADGATIPTLPVMFAFRLHFAEKRRDHGTSNEVTGTTFDQLNGGEGGIRTPVGGDTS